MSDELMHRIVVYALLLVSLHAQRALSQSDSALPTKSPEVHAPDWPAVDPQLAPPADEIPLEDAPGSLIAEPLTEPLLAQPAAQEETGCARALSDFWGYHSTQHEASWMVGDGNQLGDFSFASDYYQPSGEASGLGVGFGIHFLAGPEQTDMPPRLYDFSLGYQKRAMMADLAYDVAVAVMAASDFEGSSRRGIRFPSHAVGYIALEPNLDIVLGADFLDREDIRVLPVAGLLWRPVPDVRMELVFPYPRVDVQLTDEYRLYLGGGLGGGTWAVERDNEVDDLATYGDLRIAIGMERLSPDASWNAFEIAYLFDRRLEFTSQVGDYRPDGTVLIRSVTRY